ncbi:tetratricopeptide repeat-containing sensor histidine kinase [Aquimarina longa]|uniref:tetratricopeptide repeat-containing sensor histidine kinase n=1 Tax=Aquimarina longa TaxID=1080221 RepID=UPI0007822ADF|nr:ATP-binding protein [Aquimarina longa]
MKLWRVDFLFYSIFLLLLCNTIPSFAQTKVPYTLSIKELDSITQYYRLSKADSLSIPDRLHYVNSFLEGISLSRHNSLIYNGLMQKTMLLGRIKNYDSAIKYSHQLYNLAKQNNDTIYIKHALFKLGRYHKNNNQLVDAFDYYNQGFKISRIGKDSAKAGKNLLQMANIQASLGDYLGSKTTAIDGVKYIEKTSNIKNIAGLYHIISVANREQKNYTEALKYNEKAFKLDTNSSRIQILKNTKANILANQGDYINAILLLKSLVSDSIVQKNKSKYARVLGNLGYILWLKNKNNKKSEALLLEALYLCNEIKDIKGLIGNNIYLTKYYLEKDKIKALNHAESAYHNAKKLHSLTSILEALGFIFELREATNVEAKEFKEIYNKIKEINQNNREIYAVTRYENDKLTTENLILKAETAKKEQQQIIYLFSTLLLLLGGGLVFYLFRQRHKREKIREVYNAETRISKKLHDELANDIYHVMVQIQNNQNNHDVLDKLETIYNSTRDISREHNSFRTGQEYTTELSGMLSSYSTNNTKIIIKGIDEINWQSITPEKKIIVHRTLQELMVNMKKHSQAELVAIAFKKNSKNIMITYADTGVGVSKKEIIYSNGLRNTENRIKTIGGSFIFDSEKGKGFKARIYFPN